MIITCNDYIIYYIMITVITFHKNVITTYAIINFSLRLTTHIQLHENINFHIVPFYLHLLLWYFIFKNNYEQAKRTKFLLEVIYC